MSKSSKKNTADRVVLEKNTADRVLDTQNITVSSPSPPILDLSSANRTALPGTCALKLGAQISSFIDLLVLQT
jgi:hypothetical protein